MQTFVLIMTLIAGDHETGEITNIALSTGLSEADCVELLDLTEQVWLGNPNVGMHCEVDASNGEFN